MPEVVVVGGAVEMTTGEPGPLDEVVSSSPEKAANCASSSAKRASNLAPRLSVPPVEAVTITSLPESDAGVLVEEFLSDGGGAGEVVPLSVLVDVSPPFF